MKKVLEEFGIIIGIWVVIAGCIEPYIEFDIAIHPVLKNLLFLLFIPMMILFILLAINITRASIKIIFVTFLSLLLLLSLIYILNLFLFKEIHIFSTQQIINVEFKKINNNLFSIFNKRIYKFDLQRIGDDDSDLFSFITENQKKIRIPGGIYEIKYDTMEKYEIKTKNYYDNWKPKQQVSDTLYLP